MKFFSESESHLSEERTIICSGLKAWSIVYICMVRNFDMQLSNAITLTNDETNA